MALLLKNNELYDKFFVSSWFYFWYTFTTTWPERRLIRELTSILEGELGWWLVLTRITRLWKSRRTLEEIPGMCILCYWYKCDGKRCKWWKENRKGLFLLASLCHPDWWCILLSFGILPVCVSLRPIQSAVHVQFVHDTTYFQQDHWLVSDMFGPYPSQVR